MIVLNLFRDENENEKDKPKRSEDYTLRLYCPLSLAYNTRSDHYHYQHRAPALEARVVHVG